MTSLSLGSGGFGRFFKSKERKDSFSKEKDSQLRYSRVQPDPDLDALTDDEFSDSDESDSSGKHFSQNERFFTRVVHAEPKLVAQRSNSTSVLNPKSLSQFTRSKSVGDIAGLRLKKENVEKPSSMDDPLITPPRRSRVAPNLDRDYTTDEEFSDDDLNPDVKEFKRSNFEFDKSFTGFKPHVEHFNSSKQDKKPNSSKKKVQLKRELEMTQLNVIKTPDDTPEIPAPRNSNEETLFPPQVPSRFAQLNHTIVNPQYKSTFSRLLNESMNDGDKIIPLFSLSKEPLHNVLRRFNSLSSNQSSSRLPLMLSDVPGLQMDIIEDNISTSPNRGFGDLGGVVRKLSLDAHQEVIVEGVNHNDIEFTLLDYPNSKFVESQPKKSDAANEFIMIPTTDIKTIQVELNKLIDNPKDNFESFKTFVDKVHDSQPEKPF
jgi:hypothetical protein